MHRLDRATSGVIVFARTPLAQRHLGWQFERPQRELLDPRRPFRDWYALLEARREARRLEDLCEEQLDALQEWRDERLERNDADAQGPRGLHALGEAERFKQRRVFAADALEVGDAPRRQFAEQVAFDDLVALDELAIQVLACDGRQCRGRGVHAPVIRRSIALFARGSARCGSGPRDRASWGGASRVHPRAEASGAVRSRNAARHSGRTG